jgi:hypothetical protein
MNAPQQVRSTHPDEARDYLRKSRAKTCRNTEDKSEPDKQVYDPRSRHAIPLNLVTRPWLLLPTYYHED